MEQIKLYYDKDCINSVEKNIKFKPLIIGTQNFQSLFIKSFCDYTMSIKLIPNDEDVKIKTDKIKLAKNESKEILFEITPSLTRMKGINCSFNLEVSYYMD
jgi:hypothetical protein